MVVVDEPRLILVLLLNLLFSGFILFVMVKQSCADNQIIRSLFKQLEKLSSQLDATYDEIEILEDVAKDINTSLLTLINDRSSNTTVDTADNSHKEKPSIDYHDGEGVLW